MKMHTVCGRGKNKDFFDIYALLQLYSCETLLDWFITKYGKSQLAFLYRSILYFEDAEGDSDINALDPFTKSWFDINKEIALKCI